MYIPDGTNTDYRSHNPAGDIFYAWGWLESDKPYTTGWTSEKEKQDFLTKLGQLKTVDLCRGSHTDEGLGLTWRDHSNGSKKFTQNGVVYVAPNAVTFYIEKLDYCPPLVVRQALDMFLMSAANV